MMKLSHRTVLNKRRDRIAKGIIWGFALLTIAILFWIVGYLLFRGFYYDKSPVYNVTRVEETDITAGPGTPGPFSIIVHKKILAKDLTFEDLHTIYTKPRRENWGFYTTQDIKVRPYAPVADSDFGSGVKDYLLYEGEDYSKYTHFESSPVSIVRTVGATEGAVGIVPSSALNGTDPDLLKRVKVVPLRLSALAINPSVMEIVDNKKMQELDEDGVSRIFSGAVQNWKEVGGIDLPLRVILPPKNSAPYSGMAEKHGAVPQQIPDHWIRTETLQDYFRTLKDTDGAIGVVLSKDIAEKELAHVEVQRRERGLNLTLRFLLEPPARSGKWGGISTIIINTLFLIILTLVFSTPIGIAAAVYLVEYAKQGRMVKVLRMGTETLAGIPSIIFGLFGHIIFVRVLGLGIGFISATLTVTLMILPTIIRTTEEALKAVPDSYREGSLALGTTKLQTIWKVVIPAAIPGILTGVILAIGRVVGETAVLLYTLGSSYNLVNSLTSSARVLSLHLYLLFSEAISFERAFATGAILVFIIIIVNFATTRLAGKNE